MDVEVHGDLMHEDVAVIWVSVKNGGRSIMKVGGVYREHQMLLKTKPNPTLEGGGSIIQMEYVTEGVEKCFKEQNVYPNRGHKPGLFKVAAA